MPSLGEQELQLQLVTVPEPTRAAVVPQSAAAQLSRYATRKREQVTRDGDFAGAEGEALLLRRMMTKIVEVWRPVASLGLYERRELRHPDGRVEVVQPLADSTPGLRALADLALPTFCAIDYETWDSAGERKGKDSACALAVVRVEQGQVVDRGNWLIRPPREPQLTGGRGEFTHIHNLYWHQLRDRPSFAQVWPEALAKLAGAAWLVAHNASFDRAVTEACCAVAGLEAPTLPWLCTVKVARKAWPRLPNHKLNTVCSALGVALQHHDALSDTEACAQVLLAGQRVLGSAFEAERFLVGGERTGRAA